jgi:hypothetical protein
MCIRKYSHAYECVCMDGGRRVRARVGVGYVGYVAPQLVSASLCARDT